MATLKKIRVLQQIQFLNTSSEVCLSILHLNIRSIRNKLEFIRDNFLDYDVLCFTETHLTADIQSDFLRIEGYNESFSVDNTAHSGGLLVYIACHLQA